MGRSEIISLLSSAEALVTYVPIEAEVPFHTYLDLPKHLVRHEIAPRSTLDPKEEAALASSAIGRLRTIILIPGRAFDTLGTRHGRGGGWYDRFLASAPASWTRIGFCFDEQFSASPLPRESWDQPVDYVAVATRDGDSTLHKTNART